MGIQGTVDLSQHIDDQGIQGQASYKKVSSLNIYDFMEMTYEGSGIYRDGTGLVPHAREMDYSKRREIAHYKNYLKPIVRAMVEPVFTDEAIRKIEDDNENEQTGLMINSFIEDADNDGSSLQDITEDVVSYARLHGLSFAVVDNFRADELNDTVAANMEGRKYPYVYMRKANQVKAFKIDKFGRLEKIVFYDFKEDVDTESKEKSTTEYLREWDNEKSQVYKKDPKTGKFVKDGEPFYHNLGAIPVIVLYSVRRKDKNILMVDPPLYDIAKINYTMFNKDSEIREIERAQGFSFLFAQGIEPGDLTVGTDNYLNLPEGASIAPGYCSPDPNIQKVLMEYNNALKEDVFTIAEQNGVTGVTDQSGVAKQWDFFAHESVLKKTSRMAVTVEEKIVHIFQLYTGEKFVYIVEYKTDFQPNDILKEVETYERYLDLQPASKGRALAMGSVARIIFRDQPPAKVKEIAEQEEKEADDVAQSKLKGDGAPDNLE